MSIAGLTDETQTATQTTNVFERLREDVLSGRLSPLRKLQMRFLIDAYGVGQTPLREALNRLSAEGLIECRDQRGFYVTGISQSELLELNETRCWMETLALRKSMEAASSDWEEDVLIAHHRLSRTKRSLDPEHFEDNPEWEHHHGVFHRTLINHCGSRPLVAFCKQLADQLYRYRRLSARKAYLSRPINDEHRALLDAVIDKDIERATSLLDAHYRQTAEVILGDSAIFSMETQG